MGHGTRTCSAVSPESPPTVFTVCVVLYWLAWPVFVSRGNGSQSNAVLYLSHTLNATVAVTVVPLLSALAKRGRNVRYRFEMRILPSKSQRKESRGLVVEDTMSVILHYRISETFEV
jgi:hypothetical protein